MRRYRSVVALILSIGFGCSALAQCQSCPERRSISVNASGTASAAAELAIVHVGYKLYGPDAKSVYSSASDTSNAIMQALTESGVAKSAIESTSQLIQHATPYEIQELPMGSEERARRKFTVTQSWTVKVKPDDAAKVLNTAINAGANESGWIEWTLDNPSVLQARAAAKALANARAIAEQMVQGTDVHLGHLVSVTENQQPRVMGGPMDSLAFNGMAMVGNGNEPLAINSREIECTVTLYAVFAIE